MSSINLIEIFSTFLVMFAIIDITGSIPIFVAMRDQGKRIQPLQATGVALLLFVAFYFVGDGLLRLFSIDAPSFAVAGAVVLFILALEMILGRDIIKNETTSSGASVVPIAFPLIAGPGAITALISLRAEYATVNIMVGLLLNIVLDYFVLRYLDRITHWLGSDLIYVLRKFFGVILLAMAMKLFASNVTAIFPSDREATTTSAAATTTPATASPNTATIESDLP
ncbi:MAG: MarC family protein [Bacteroidales bacterium]|nr:MarC family protein [Bacteroidales bacterium]